ncbi:hypothetical protein C806_01646 [Lachnospiraceae bacterium 3-1]|nr:hypothetical protein C806_01646 [Lachnospiraceae bacterium 3-1]
MNELNLSENITRLRRERKLTQEELADFLGVTKASVSKWENAQSMPDILLLPRLAVFFGVTIDELIGYEAQLSREQIRRCYGELSKDFVNLPFDEAAQKVRAMAHRYYSCYPFLLQLSILCWNHFMLAKSQEEGKKMLQEAIQWCDRILDHCKDTLVCSDALSLKAGLNLQLGRADEVIEALEPALDPSRLAGQDGGVLVQAYRMAGKIQEAKNYVQVKEYTSLLNLVGNAVLSLSLYENDMERCEKTIQRVKGLMDLYHLEQLHPNVAAQFYCQAAIVFAGNGNNEEALASLRQFEKCIHELWGSEQMALHGDAYFDLLDVWIEALPLGSMAPRDKGFMLQSVQEIFAHPAFEGFKENKEFQSIVKRVLEGGEK